mmetsp:Transcript_29317/g.94509  ORF Transcript_29317/g.94509 Transcript_29317/m.94509 type:complete len:94 (+) Transcript_29317:352-633(+)|eukprot:scaffold33185_cov101-Isochrysis_galbana.AAC.3
MATAGHAAHSPPPLVVAAVLRLVRRATGRPPSPSPPAAPSTSTAARFLAPSRAERLEAAAGAPGGAAAVSEPVVLFPVASRISPSADSELLEL